MKLKKNPIEFRCDKCGAYQPKNEEKSNGNWNVYDSHQKCACGGTFVMWYDGKPLNSSEEAT